MIESRLATEKDIATYYGSIPRETLQAYVALKDGELVGVIGLARCKTHGRFFSEFKPEIRANLRCMTILRTIKKAMQLVKQSRVPVIAIAQADEPNSRSILERLGFQYLKPSPIGEVFKWPT